MISNCVLFIHALTPCLAVIEEPEKVKETAGLESADVWGDAADDVSPRDRANL